MECTTKKYVKRRRYDETTVNDICRRLRGGESLLRISKDPKMPSQRTLSDWVAKNHLGFAERYLNAKRVSAHFLAETALEEAYNSANDFYLDDDGRPVFDGHHVQRSKLIIDTIKWEVGKMLPKLYGDKITQELDVTGDLAMLLESASNRDKGLPRPIDVDFEVVPQREQPVEELAALPDSASSAGATGEDPAPASHHHYLRGLKSAPSTPSNHRRNRRGRRRPTS